MRNYDYRKHLILTGSTVRAALASLNELASDAILFVTTAEGKLLGSLTDGDVRRGLLAGLTIDEEVDKFIQQSPKFIQRGNYTIEEVIG